MGFLAMLAILDEDDLIIALPNQTIYEFVIKIATGDIKFEEIAVWLKTNSIKL